MSLSVPTRPTGIEWVQVPNCLCPQEGAVCVRPATYTKPVECLHSAHVANFPGHLLRGPCPNISDTITANNNNNNNSNNNNSVLVIFLFLIFLVQVAIFWLFFLRPVRGLPSAVLRRHRRRPIVPPTDEPLTLRFTVRERSVQTAGTSGGNEPIRYCGVEEEANVCGSGGHAEDEEKGKGDEIEEIRNRGRVFNVDHGVREEVCTPKQLYSLPPPPPPPKLPPSKLTPRQQNVKPSHEQPYNDADFIAALSAATTGMVVDKKKPKPQQADASVFMEALSAATTGMDQQQQGLVMGRGNTKKLQNNLKVTPQIFLQHFQQQQQQALTKEQTDQEILEEFLESVSAVTTHLDIAQKDKPKKRKKETKEEEKIKAIATITPKP
uniref:Uncharacterized protein n=1 Tax=Globodera rostochiensis TaxID=31243 RepID=A0A914IHP0_GLORO